MSTIYVVSSYGGQYEDSWEDLLFAVTSVEAAEAAVAKLELQHEKLKGAHDVIQEAWYKLPNRPTLPEETLKFALLTAASMGITSKEDLEALGFVDGFYPMYSFEYYTNFEFKPLELKGL
jgi:hypothetical protein